MINKLLEKEKRLQRRSSDKWKQRRHFLHTLEKYKTRRNCHRRFKMKTNPSFAISVKLRIQLSKRLKRYTKKGKIKSSKKYGVNIDNIVKELVNKLPNDFYKQKYHIDHIRPVSSFNLNNINEVKKAFSKENLQWLTAKENLSKGNKFPYTN